MGVWGKKLEKSVHLLVCSFIHPANPALLTTLYPALSQASGTQQGTKQTRLPAHRQI